METKNNKSKGLLATLFPDTATQIDKLPNNAYSPQQIMLLVSYCEKLVAELQGRDENKVIVLLKLLAKLKQRLLYIFKKKQSEVLNLHWQKIKEENEAYSKKINELITNISSQQIEPLREANVVNKAAIRQPSQ